MGLFVCSEHCWDFRSRSRKTTWNSSKDTWVYPSLGQFFGCFNFNLICNKYGAVLADRSIFMMTSPLTSKTAEPDNDGFFHRQSFGKCYLTKIFAPIGFPNLVPSAEHVYCVLYKTHKVIELWVSFYMLKVDFIKMTKLKNSTGLKTFFWNVWRRIKKRNRNYLSL